MMYCQDQAELEDDLYQENEGDSDGSEVNSELEFHLYSQLHYSNPGDMDEEVDGEDGKDSQQHEVTEKAAVDDGGQERTKDSRPSSPDSKQSQPLPTRKGKKNEKEKKGKIKPKGQKSPSFLEEVIVIDSGPDVISISDSDTSSDDVGVCALKGQGSQRLQTSTPAQQVKTIETRNCVHGNRYERMQAITILYHYCKNIDSYHNLFTLMYCYSKLNLSILQQFHAYKRF